MMNIRDRVHFTPQDSLCPSHNALKSIGTYRRPAINNGVDYRFVLGCQKPDCYKGTEHAGHTDERNGFGKHVVGSVHFHPLQADEVPSQRKMVSLKRLKSALQLKKSDSVSKQELLIDIESFLSLI